MLNLIDQSKCECPICLQIAISPIILPCGHCYCLKCFEENSIFNLRCCMCRLDVSTQDILPAKMVQNLIQRYPYHYAAILCPPAPKKSAIGAEKGSLQNGKVEGESIYKHLDLEIILILKLKTTVGGEESSSISSLGRVSLALKPNSASMPKYSTSSYRHHHEDQPQVDFSQKDST